MRRSLLLSATTAAVSTLLACSTLTPRGDPFDRASQGEAGRQLHIEVVNRSYSDATVYAISRTRRVRLGMAPSIANRTYSIDWSGGADELRAEIDVLAGGEFTTRAITASPGESVTLVIEDPLRNSYLRN